MRITKLEHSGIVAEKAGQCLVFDPVEIAEKLPPLQSVVGVILTHKHGDHFQVEQIARIIESNPDVRIFTTSDVASEVSRAEVVRNGDIIKVGDFELKIFGQNHASIVPGVVPCENIGVVVDDILVNPGDSFDFPADEIRPVVLCVPIASPWNKVSESMDYIKAHGPQYVIPVHDAVLSKFGQQIQNNWLRQACEASGIELAALEIGGSLEV